MRFKLPMGYFGKVRVNDIYDSRRAVKFIKMRRFRLLSVMALVLIPAAVFGLSNNSASLQSTSSSNMKDSTNSSEDKPLEVNNNMNQSTNDTSHTNVSINSSVSSNSRSANSQSSTSSSVSSTVNSSGATLTINGKTTQLPANGSISKDIPGSNGGNTHVDVSVSGNGDSDSNNSSTSSLNFQITNQSTGGEADGSP